MRQADQQGRRSSGRAAWRWPIFLQPDVTANETDAIGHQLDGDAARSRTFHFVDKPQAYAEFKDDLRRQP